MAKRYWPGLYWWRHAALYGALLAVGAATLQWLDYRWLARTHSTELYLLLVASVSLRLASMSERA
ncbi:hypothetical protein [Sphingomonas sp.]|uniref:hypothetical protein n=1 Tax=Sphingomonas sp. TaxID=28214 RepID=UPI002E14A3B7|nr:hypothetical protein [Sphingomonas sp.]